jgi:hypothetical protein
MSPTVFLPSSSSGSVKPQDRTRTENRRPSCEVEDEEGRIHLLLHLPIEEENEHRSSLWRPDQAGFDSLSIFDGALVEDREPE